MVHIFEEVRTRTPVVPNEAAPEAIMPQAAWGPSSATQSKASAPPTPPKPSANGSRPPTPRPGPSAPPPTLPPPHREGEGHGQGEGKGQQGTLRQGGTEEQAPIRTGHRDRQNVGAANHPRTMKGQERGPRHRGRGHHGRRRDPHPGGANHDGGTSAAPPGAYVVRLPGTHTPNTRPRSKNLTPYGSHQRTPTSHRKPHGGWRAHLHEKNGLHPERKPQGTPPCSAPPRPQRQTTTPAATRATSQAPEEDKGTATETRARDRDPQRTRDQGTGPQGGQPHGHQSNPPAGAARPGPHSTDPASHPHLTAAPVHQPATLRPALSTMTQARLTSTDPPQHNTRQHGTPHRSAPECNAPRQRTPKSNTPQHDATQRGTEQHNTARLTLT